MSPIIIRILALKMGDSEWYWEQKLFSIQHVKSTAPLWCYSSCNCRRSSSRAFLMTAPSSQAKRRQKWNKLRLRRLIKTMSCWCWKPNGSRPEALEVTSEQSPVKKGKGNKAIFQDGCALSAIGCCWHQNQPDRQIHVFQSLLCLWNWREWDTKQFEAGLGFLLWFCRLRQL